MGGAGVVMLLYLIILYRVGVIVRRCTRMFPAMLVTGLGLCIVLQALINIGVVLTVIPNTGVSLPFISYGGSAVLFTMIEMGIALSVDRTHMVREVKKKKYEMIMESRS